MKKLQEVLKDWEAVIGLEVHTELTALDTKMFCNCRLSHDDAPNTNVCPVCLGMPGALPVPNRRAIESIVMAGLATNCQIQKHSMFYRKHYFYPDMAKNFQTTQGPVAFCMYGHLDLEVTGEGAKERPDHVETGNVAPGGMEAASPVVVDKSADGSYTTPIRIFRIHMEEDAAKMVHVGGEEGRIASATESLVDYNRCGTPLIELVTEPDLRTPEEARLFMEKLRQTFLTLGISDCSLENGSMRCDGNVSLRRRGTTGLGTKTELKNINSFKSLHDGLEYEICRQAEVLEEGGIIYQETRHWEPSRKRTIVMRVKETADDYRLFPDPDLAPFDLTDEFIEAARARIPELPDAKRDRYMADFGLQRAAAAPLAADPRRPWRALRQRLSRRWQTSWSTSSPATTRSTRRRSGASPRFLPRTPSPLRRRARCSTPSTAPRTTRSAWWMSGGCARSPTPALWSPSWTRSLPAAPTRFSSTTTATRRSSASSSASA